MQWVGQMDLDVSDIVQQIKQSMFWMVSLTFDLIHFVGHCPCSKYPCIGVSSKLNIMQWVGQMDLDMSDIVQQIKQSMFWMVSLTFDLIHFVGHCPANIHVLEYLAN